MRHVMFESYNMLPMCRVACTEVLLHGLKAVNYRMTKQAKGRQWLRGKKNGKLVKS